MPDQEADPIRGLAARILDVIRDDDHPNRLDIPLALSALVALTGSIIYAVGRDAEGREEAIQIFSRQLRDLQVRGRDDRIQMH